MTVENLFKNNPDL